MSTIEVKGSGEGGVGSRAGEGKGCTIAAVVTKGTIAVAAEKATLNSLIIRVTFRKIVLSGLGASKGTLSLIAVLNEVG